MSAVVSFPAAPGEPTNVSERRRVSDEDADMFRRAVGKVRRMEHDRAGPDPSPRRRAVRRPDEPAVPVAPFEADPATAHGERLEYADTGVQQRVLRRLRRGHLRVEDALDLHGMRVAEAHAHLVEFLAGCRERGLRCVRVVHGKGRGSRGPGPVLKASVGHWLRHDAAVVAYCSAPERDGGTGAVHVLLRGPDGR